MTRYVGIRNSVEKVRVLEQGPSRTERVAVDDLTYDCIRHLDFLERLRRSDGDVGWFPESLYYRYLCARGRDTAAAEARCRRFVELAQAIAEQGFDQTRDPVAVTPDGMRLNGSHRAAIARSLDIDELDVGVYEWPDRIGGGAAARAEAEAKRTGQAGCVGKEALDAENGARLGTVVFVDTVAADDPGLLVVLEDERLELHWRSADDVVLRS